MLILNTNRDIPEGTGYKNGAVSGRKIFSALTRAEKNYFGSTNQD